MPCSKCPNTIIANVKYNLCSSCNSVRLTGKTLAERQSESVVRYQSKVKSKGIRKGWKDLPSGAILQPTKRIKPTTEKEAVVKAALSKLKQEIRLEAVQNNEYYCKGCGNTGALDCSHILSVGRFKRYELIKANIQLLCRSCHNIWESATIEQQMNLICFQQNLDFIKTLEPLEYQKFVTRMEERAEKYF